jgi:hypothetical protein
MNRSLLIISAAFLFGCSSAHQRGQITRTEFSSLLDQVAEGWNEGDAKKAAAVFAGDAVYQEPPGKQLYKGHASIFEFFGGEKGFDRPMKMKWHNMAFNEDVQVGFGEYTFAMNNQYHGIVVVKIENGKIISWREYQYQSQMDWNMFAGEGGFETLK